MRFHPLGASAVVLTMSMLLLGCNNDSSNEASQGAMQPSTDDAFVTQVRLQVDGRDAQSDMTTPIDIDAIQATTPDDTQPQAVAF